MKFLSDADLVRNKLRRAVLEPLASAPSTPVTGQVYFDTTLGYGREWTGTVWQRIGGTPVFVQQTNPGMTQPGIWIETNPDGTIKTFWIENGL